MISIKSAKFLYSRASFEPNAIPQICFCGRSNAGKSSLINMLVGQKNLARVSNEPGRTGLINYFEIELARDDNNISALLVDLPGYGYAKVSKTKKLEWQDMIQQYIELSSNLKLAVSIVDSKIPPQESDILLIDYLYKLNVPFIIIGAKVDRLKKYEIIHSKNIISSAFKIGIDNIIMSSSITKQGKQEIINKLYSVVIDTSNTIVV